MGYTRHGLMKILLSHHPVRNYYTDHVIQLFRVKFCLGCSGFYFSLLLSIVFSFMGVLGSNWVFLVISSLLFFSPSIGRLVIHVPSKLKTLLFLSKVSLGLAVGIGLYSIILVGNLLIMSFQLLFGFVLYILMAYQRSNNPSPECGPCNYNPSPVWFGMSPFYDHKIEVSLALE